MKKLTFYLFISCFFILPGYAQNDLPNGHFYNACTGFTRIGACYTWSPACGDGWVRSHGTPQMKVFHVDPKTNQTYYVAYMWHANNLGEGMFTNYSFQANQTYRVSILFRHDNPNGTFWILAANNVTNTGTACGNPIPLVPDRTAIGAFSGPMNDVSQSLYFEFTPDKDYSQIWLYPFSEDIQYNLNVIYVEISTYQQRKVSPDSTTTISDSTSSSFEQIRELYNRVNPPLFTSDEGKQEPLSTQKDIRIYPTITKGMVHFSGKLKDWENGVLAVYDLTGKQVFSINKRTDVSKVDLSHLVDGIYILQLKNAAKTISEKIVIRH